MQSNSLIFAKSRATSEGNINREPFKDRNWEQATEVDFKKLLSLYLHFCVPDKELVVDDDIVLKLNGTIFPDSGYEAHATVNLFYDPESNFQYVASGSITQEEAYVMKPILNNDLEAMAKMDEFGISEIELTCAFNILFKIIHGLSFHKEFVDMVNDKAGSYNYFIDYIVGDFVSVKDTDKESSEKATMLLPVRNELVSQFSVIT